MKYFVVALILFSMFVGVIPYVDARSADEPCSYLNPTKYIRDSGGNCVLAPQTPVQQVVPSTATATAPANSSGNLLEVAVIFLVGILAFIAYKIFGERLRQPRTKYRPRQTPPQKPEPFVGNQSTTESSTTVQEAAETWNGGYYDDDTLEKFK